MIHREGPLSMKSKLVLLMVICSQMFASGLRAQGSFDAFTFPEGPPVPDSYVSGQGLAVSFIPNVDIRLTQVGVPFIFSEVKINLVSGDKTVMATYNTTAPGFKAVSPYLLQANRLYFLTVEDASGQNGAIVTQLFQRPGAKIQLPEGSHLPGFDVSPFIQYNGVYFTHANQAWNSAAPEGVLLLGANFRFDPVPEPSFVAFAGLAAGIMLVARDRASNKHG
jgi:hypothetical protein